MRTRHRALLALGLLLVALAIFAWWASSWKGDGPIGFTFLGFTNQPLQLQQSGRSRAGSVYVRPITIWIPSALLLVRNESSKGLTLLVPGQSVYSQQGLDFAPSSANGLPKVLKPGESCVVQAYPKGTNPWWTAVSCQRYGPLERLHDRLLRSGNRKALAWFDRLYSAPAPVVVRSGLITNCLPARDADWWPNLSRLYPAPSLRDGGYYE